MEKKKNTDRKPFNFGDSPIVQQTEQTVVTGYQRIEKEEQGGEAKSVRTASNDNLTATRTVASETRIAVPEEETKGIQAYIPMSLYERLMMRKLRTKETLGAMFVQAIKLWIDVQEGKATVQQQQ